MSGPAVTPAITAAITAAPSLAEKYMGTETYPGAPAITHAHSECWWCLHAAPSLAEMARDILVRDKERAAMVSAGASVAGGGTSVVSVGTSVVSVGTEEDPD